MTTDAGTNWAGNLAFSAREVAAPRSIDDLRGILRGADRVRALGTRHSFNDIADTPGVLITTAALPAEVSIDSGERVARVASGLRYGDVAQRLDAAGWALANLASLPHISVAGGVATGTHGSGDRVGSLAASVRAIELVTADGDEVRLARGDATFDGAVVALGSLGVVTAVELDIEPRYSVAQTAYPDLAFDEVLADLSAVTGAGYSVSMFTSWADADRVDAAWVKRRTEHDVPPDTLLGSPARVDDGHPLAEAPPDNATQQGGRVGLWLDRLPHFKLGFTPSNGDELQTEYLVPRARATDALNTMRDLASRIHPLVMVSEIRTVAADSLWLSPAFGRDVVAIHFTWKPDQPAVEALLPVLEQALAPMDARPHWGKLFAADVDTISGLYPRFDDARALTRQFDPRRVFVNRYLERVLGL
ncbi:FAD-binding protein [Glaciibacter flavus]|uniref:FAD-binding protein n=1 Tax=Orlajensenia flava TaxID=2565934 RepID=A0A4S4FP84_9MICO|nr:D-arabinono-1,4-lactone oxidase [Glaciibacter flavus]THG31345.1 FAD-binding protein [Glaciibacter flavus]